MGKRESRNSLDKFKLYYEELQNKRKPKAKKVARQNNNNHRNTRSNSRDSFGARLNAKLRKAYDRADVLAYRTFYDDDK